jgi:hypothetical protein
MQLDPIAVTIFNGILEAVRGVSRVQNKIVQNMLVSQAKQATATVYGQASLGASSKRPRPEQGGQGAPAIVIQGEVTRKDTPVIVPDQVRVQAREPVPVPETEQDRKVRKFRDCIRTAERSTIIFNLDMGHVPVMNKETMSKRATMSRIRTEPGPQLMQLKKLMMF